MSPLICISCNGSLSDFDIYINAGVQNPRCEKCFSEDCQRILDSTEAMLREIGEVTDTVKLKELTSSMNNIISTFYMNAPASRRLVQIVNIAETCLETITSQRGPRQ